MKEPAANTTRTVDLSLIFSEELEEAPEPYERLLCDAMCGDSSHFTREDGVEETWRIVQPLLDAPPRWSPTSPERGVRPAPTNLLRGIRIGAIPGFTLSRRSGSICARPCRAEKAEGFRAAGGSIHDCA